MVIFITPFVVSLSNHEPFDKLRANGKKYLFLALVSILPLLLQAQTLDDAFRNGKVSGALRTFWYDG
ncbi:MAG: hypothetical protein WCW84_12000, partial [Sulfurimonas sp.]